MSTTIAGRWVGHRNIQGTVSPMTAHIRPDGSLDLTAGVWADAGSWHRAPGGFACRLVHRLDQGGAVVMRLTAEIADDVLTGTGTFAVVDGAGAVARSGEWGIRASRADITTNCGR